MKAELPVINCPPDCGHCCTIASCHEHEYRAILAYAKEHNVTPKRQGIQCPFWQGGCAVYPVRPHVCRVYGHSSHPMLTCPKGLNRNRTALVERMTTEYLKRGKPVRTTHEACFEQDEIEAMVQEELVGGLK